MKEEGGDYGHRGEWCSRGESGLSESVKLREIANET